MDLYLSCLDCGESFDTIRTAYDHPCDSQEFPTGAHFSIQDEL